MPVHESGTFSWDSGGSRVTLVPAETGETQQYQVVEHALFHLDKAGRRVSGDLAGRYRLEKHINDPAIEQHAWLLIELGGQLLPESPGQPFLTFAAEVYRVSGNTSCNSFNGTYAIKRGNRIRFGRNLAVTEMACPDMTVEQDFLEMLETVDSYAIGSDGTLSLNRARMAPLARFKLALHQQ